MASPQGVRRPSSARIAEFEACFYRGSKWQQEASNVDDLCDRRGRLGNQLFLVPAEGSRQEFLDCRGQPRRFGGDERTLVLSLDQCDPRDDAGFGT